MTNLHEKKNSGNKQKRCNILMDKSETIIPRTKVKRWTEYIQELFEAESHKNILIKNIGIKCGPNIKEKVNHSMKLTKNNKTTGSDSIPT